MKYNDEELQLLLLNWIADNDFCCPIKKIEASSFDFDQLQPCSSNKLYFLVELQRNKDDNMRRTLGDYKLIQSTVLLLTEKERLSRKTYSGFKKEELI